MSDQWNDKIFRVNEAGFEKLALEIFQFQYRYNKLYRAYADMLKIGADTIKLVSQIPFLPIQFFKTHAVQTTEFEPQVAFESSGTSQSATSHHFVKDIELYRQSFLKGFEMFYGSAGEWCIIALLPSYLERQNSSLVFMMDELIRRTQHERSGFYLYDHDKLHETLKQLEGDGQKTILLGVSFALLDFAERYALPLERTVIMETGGMKGRGEEIIRDKLHQLLKDRFQVESIHSEYGMTELFSQAYSNKDGVFRTPPWMKIFMRDEEDPLTLQTAGSLDSATDSPYATGAINVIDLANVYSCSFIATDDAGKLYPDGSFEVLGRIDNSDIRGCSLMML